MEQNVDDDQYDIHIS